MSNSLLYFVAIAGFVTSSVAQTPVAVTCGACRLIISELEKDIRTVDPKKKVQLGSYRVDPLGNQFLNEVPYARSEVYLHELLEKVCDRTASYGLTIHPITKKPVIVDIHEVGKTGNKVVVDTSDNIKSRLKLACDDVIEHLEDDIIKFLNKEFKDPAELFCHRYHDYCEKDAFISFPDFVPPESNEPIEKSANEL